MMRLSRSPTVELAGPRRKGAAVLIFALLMAGGVAPGSSPFLGLLVVFALLSAAGWAGWRVAGALIPRDGVLSRIVCAFTFAVAAITCGATLLGHFGQLRPGPFLLLEGVLFLASLCLPAAPRLVFEAVTRAPLRSAAGAERTLLLAATAALALRFGGSAFQAARDPRAFLAYDDLSYHLPAAAVWRQAGDLRMLKFEIGDPSPTFYPFNSELCSWALLAPLGDSDLLARRVQLPFALGSLIAAAAIARRLGLSRRGALLAALLYAGVDRVIPVLALGAGNDHAAAFFTLAALDGGLGLLRAPARGPAAYTGAALGLLVGTKYIGLFFAVTVLAALAAVAIVRLAAGSFAERSAARSEGAMGGRWKQPAEERPRQPVEQRSKQPGGERSRQAAEERLKKPADNVAHRVPLLQVVGLVVVLMAVCGGYAYARNLWTAGNPVFPVPVSLFGQPLWSGWGFTGLEWRRHRPEFRIDTLSFLTRRSDLFGPLFVWTMLPAALIAPMLALALRRARLAAVLALPVLLFLEFRYLMHDHRDMRYVLAAVALGAIAAAWLAEMAGEKMGEKMGAVLRAAALLGLVLTVAGRLHASGWRQAVLLALLLAGGALASGALASRGLASGALASPGLASGGLVSGGLAVGAEDLRRAGPDRLSAGAWPSSSAGGWLSSRGAWAALGLLGLVAAAAWRGGRLIDSSQARKLAGEPAAIVLDAATARDGARVAYVGSNQPYLYFGSRLQNDVQIVPTDADLADQYYFWGGSAHFPFGGGSAGRWRANLIARGVEYVVAARTPDEGPERAWMAADPMEFKPLYQDARAEIWRFQRPAAGGR